MQIDEKLMDRVANLSLLLRAANDADRHVTVGVSSNYMARDAEAWEALVNGQAVYMGSDRAVGSTPNRALTRAVDFLLAKVERLAADEECMARQDDQNAAYRRDLAAKMRAAARREST